MDKNFKVEMERSRIYWDYYKSVYKALTTCMAAGIIAAAVIYTKGEINLTFAGGIILLMFLVTLFLTAILNLMIWRHENQHLDELMREDEPAPEEKPHGRPLV